MKKKVIIICAILCVIVAASGAFWIAFYSQYWKTYPVPRHLTEDELTEALANQFQLTDTDLRDTAKSYYAYTEEEMTQYQQDKSSFFNSHPGVEVNKDYAVRSLQGHIDFEVEQHLHQIGQATQAEFAARERILAVIKQDVESDTIDAWTALYAADQGVNFELPNKEAAESILEKKYPHTVPKPFTVKVVCITVLLIALIVVVGLLITKRKKAIG